MSASYAAEYPSYAATRALDDLRARDIPCSTASGTCISTTRPAISCRCHSSTGTWQLLRDHLLGNPHSTNPASALATTFIEQARLSVLDFFNADPDEFVVIFTANATQALKLVGEAYPFDAAGEYLLTFDNHNSVNGIREFARAKGCPTTYVPIVLPDMRVDEAELAIASRARQPRRPPPVCLSGTIELLRRAASARLDSARAGARLGRAARRGGVYADQPPRSRPLEARLRVAELLQDVRLSDRRRLPHRHARRRSRNCGGRGLRAARSRWRRFRATSSISRKARRHSRTARRTISRCLRRVRPPVLCRRSASTRFTRACAASPDG